MTKSEKVPILGIFSPKTILMFRVGLKKIGYVGNRNHIYISFKPNLNTHTKAHLRQIIYKPAQYFLTLKVSLYIDGNTGPMAVIKII